MTDRFSDDAAPCASLPPSLPSLVHCPFITLCQQMPCSLLPPLCEGGREWRCSPDTNCQRDLLSALALGGDVHSATRGKGRKGLSLSLSPLFLRGIVRVGRNIMMDYYNSVKGIMGLVPSLGLT